MWDLWNLFDSVNSEHPSAQCAHWAPPLRGEASTQKIEENLSYESCINKSEIRLCGH